MTPYHFQKLIEDGSARSLGPHSMLVLLILWVSVEIHHINPRYEDIMDQSGLCRTTVARTLAKLKATGYISFQRYGRETNTYTLNLPS